MNDWLVIILTILMALITIFWVAITAPYDYWCTDEEGRVHGWLITNQLLSYFNDNEALCNELVINHTKEMINTKEKVGEDS